MNKSKIEWTDRTWNCVVGCTKVSQGCKLCYAKTLHDMRHEAHLAGKKVAPQYAHPFETVQLMPDRLQYPLSLRQPSRIFVNSVSDLFHEDVPDEFIDEVFGVMCIASRHTFQILTKRPERLRDYIASLARRTQLWNPPRSNIWLGVSVENQAAADERIPLLLDTPAAVRFLSCEPLLGPVQLHEWWRLGQCGDDSHTIDWVIVGGESGSSKQDPRPMHPDWARSLRDQCVNANIPFLFKQWGVWIPSDEPENASDRVGLIDLDGCRNDPTVGTVRVMRVGKKRAGRELDGLTWDQYPQPRTT